MINPEWTLFQPDKADWREFLDLAGREGWQAPPQEIDLYRKGLRGDAWVAKGFGRTIGFVTAVAYQRTGWVGNLLVAPGFRGRGMGGRLFDFALERLSERGLEETWLTASHQGRKIYRGRGFKRIDGIVRWTHLGSGDPDPTSFSEVDFEALFQADRNHWRDKRRRMLEGITDGALVFQSGETVALLQAGERTRILGPWYSPDICPRENRLILTGVLDSFRGTVMLDVLESSPVNQLLGAAGFQRVGRTDLMVKGNERPDLRGIVALASLGSLG